MGNVDCDLWEKMEAIILDESSTIGEVEGSGSEEEGSEEGEERQDEDPPDVSEDPRLTMVRNAVDFFIERQVDQFNTRTSQEGESSHAISRVAAVRLWRKSNLQGGSFQQKKVNHV